MASFVSLPAVRWVIFAAFCWCAHCSPPVPVTLWNMTQAKQQEHLSYDEGITAFAAQGLANRVPGQQLTFFDIGSQNYDWVHADAFWVDTLQSSQRATFTTLPPTLCSLIAAVNSTIAGLVLYEGTGLLHPYGDGASAAIALTLAGQRSLLPVSVAALGRHPCLRQMEVVEDLRETLRGKSRVESWQWAITELLPNSSKTTVFNLNRYRVLTDPEPFLFDKQSMATASSIDYIVGQNAFVLDLESHAATGRAGGTAPWNRDDELITAVFAHLEPLFDAYGWADDEGSWTNETTHGGGTVMCSFASPNLSFWALFPLADGAMVARKLPDGGTGITLNSSKYYVTFETNEGDTPRILVSAMASAWIQPQRGSIPIAWAIDPLLAEKFPALFDYFAATASRNDSFIAGTAGAGYAFLSQMSPKQLHTYAERVGKLTAQYGPHVFDAYGYANKSVLEIYKDAAAKGGHKPAAFVTQPNWLNNPQPYDVWRCPEDNMALSDGTPLICASGDPRLFYYSGGLSSSCPSCDLASRIEAEARKYKPPFFVLVYGGLQAFGGSQKKSPKNFYTLLHDTIDRLGDGFVPIGATDMARLAREAQQLSKT